MYIKELSINEFTEFSLNHPNSSYFQTYNYALIKAEKSHDYDLIGLFDNDNNLIAASLIIIYTINNKYMYGYAPNGFLMDYHNTEIVETFTKELKMYYKNLTFIKINPNIITAQIDNKTKIPNYNINKNITDTLISNGYNKLKDNLYFESIIPRFNAVINLNNYDYNGISKNTKNKISKGIRKGLTFEKVDSTYINTFYEFVKNKKNKHLHYYQDFYNMFNKDNLIDIFIVRINYEHFLINTTNLYDKEIEKNTNYNNLLINNANNRIINKKMNSDRTLLNYKNDIMEATNGLKNNKDEIIASAMTVKWKDTVYIIISGYDRNYKRFSPNYFLHYSIINYYKNDYNYINMNGMTGDFTSINPYKGLNDFKLGFNPNVYEYIGEFDLVINEVNYKYLLRNGLLAKEFNKK